MRFSGVFSRRVGLIFNGSSLCYAHTADVAPATHYPPANRSYLRRLPGTYVRTPLTHVSLSGGVDDESARFTEVAGERQICCRNAARIVLMSADVARPLFCGQPSVCLAPAL